MNTAEKIAVMQAHADGKTIECRNRHDDDDTWDEISAPKWNWVDCVYRVKPVKVDVGGWLVMRKGRAVGFATKKTAAENIRSRRGADDIVEVTGTYTPNA